MIFLQVILSNLKMSARRYLKILDHFYPTRFQVALNLGDTTLLTQLEPGAISWYSLN